MAVPDSPAELGLPHREWRKYQKESVENILSSNKRFIIMQNPTGAGKTSIALASAIIRDQKTTILTCTKRLQEQYKHELPSIEIMSGKSAYTCFINDGYTVDLAPCQSGWKCWKKHRCSYYRQKAKVAKETVPIVCSNYSFWISNRETNIVSNTDYLICDEGHLAELSLMSQIEIKIQKKHLNKVAVDFPDLASIEDAYKWAKDIQIDLERRSIEITDYISTLDEDDVFSKDYLLFDAKKLKDAIRPVKELIELFEIDEDMNTANGIFWIMDKSPTRYIFKPVWTTSLRERLFSGVGKILIQSATFPRSMIRYLGIKEDEYDYFEVPSSFPRERRPIYYWPVAYLKKGSSDDEVEKVAEAIDKIIKHKGSKKGIIHTANFTLLKKIMDYSRYSDRFITHEDSSAIEAMEEFRNSKDGILVSPSMTSGVDFPYDQCEYQIIAKIPFPDLGDPQIKARMATYEGQEWYTNVTLFTVEQTYGRVMRAQDDYGETYILDTNFKRFYAMHNDKFSSYFTEAVTLIDGLDNLTKAPSIAAVEN